MKNRQRSAALFGLFAIIACVFSSAPAYAGPTPASPTDIGVLSRQTGSPQRQAAIAGLATLVARLPESASGAGGIRHIFGIADDRTLSQATIGEGFETYLVDPKALLSGKRLGESLYGGDEWRFIVMSNGQGIGLITVARINGTWAMVQAGASELARAIASTAASYRQQAPTARLRFVRSQQAVADFIEVRPARTPDTKTNAGQPVYVPLMNARTGIAGSIESTAALSDAQLSDALRQSVRRGMRDPRVGH
ncbi:hypothetical protein AB1286_17465 [Trinickia sp. NRRL B-1857]|uniref:hypothetical protein n=1 Tax=Trinickia sp. NRRL B-1857 TaxID=3162879 RepID=UPI003D26A522